MAEKTFLSCVGVLVMVGLFAGLLSFKTIGAGERGVKTRFGAVVESNLGSGINFKVPFVEKIHVLDVKIQKEQTNADAASKDLQTVTAIVALNFHLDPTIK